MDRVAMKRSCDKHMSADAIRPTAKIEELCALFNKPFYCIARKEAERLFKELEREWMLGLRRGMEAVCAEQGFTIGQVYNSQFAKRGCTKKRVAIIAKIEDCKPIN